jgi:hypothetical protein
LKARREEARRIEELGGQRAGRREEIAGQPASRGAGAVVVGAVVDAHRHRQARRHAVASVREAVDEAGLAARAGGEDPAVQAVQDPDELEARPVGVEPADVEQPVRVAGDRHAALRIGALDGAQVGAQGIGDDAPARAARELRRGGRRRPAQPLTESQAALFVRRQAGRDQGLGVGGGGEKPGEMTTRPGRNMPGRS